MRTAALRKSGWSRTSPTGSVSYVEETATDLDAALAEQLDRGSQVLLALADVGAEPEVAGPQRRYSSASSSALSERSCTTSTAISWIARGSGGSGLAARTRTESQP